MAIIDEIISVSNGKLSFGNYLSYDKQKVSNFESDGNMYNVGTHRLVTRLEKNNGLLLEAVPGATVHDLEISDNTVEFSIEGFDSTQITMELEGATEYKIDVDNLQAGVTTSSKSGKLCFSLELGKMAKEVRIVKL